MNKIFSIFRNSSGCRMNSSLKKRFDIFIISLLALLAVPNHLSAQNELKGPGHNPPGPIEQRIIIDVSMPMERLNQQYTSSLSYSFTSSGGTVSFAAYYDPIDPNSQYSSDVEYLNDCLASVQADTLMTFTSASTSTGQMWWDFTLQILPNNTFSTNDQTKAASRQIRLVFPLSTGNTLTITVDQAKGEDRLPVFADWPDERTPITEPLISHRPDSAGQDTETLTNWIRKATYIGDNPYTPNDSIVDIVWYNGLGQPKQTVMVGASAVTSKNIITPVEYDPIGQQIREYLPYISTQATENYDALTSHKQMQYYNSIYGNSEVYPYAETIPEAATNRPIIQYTQGKVFRTDASLNETQNGIQKPRTDATGRFLSNAYRISQASDNIPMLLYENGNIVNRGHFPDGALLKTITTDPDGKTVATFTDEYEKTHLVRTYLGGYADTTETGGWSDLVYVYDRRGLLSAVITPEGENERNKTATQISVNSDWAKKRCYIYEYDGLGRMSSRRWPGKGKELFVTDPAGNVVAIQDSLLRQSGRWRLTRYDTANRPIETFLTQQSITEAQMRSYFSYETAQQYFAQNGNALFTSPVYELSDNISLTKTEIGKTDVSFNISQSLAISFKPEDQTVSQSDVDTAKFASVLWERTAMTMSKDGVLIGIAEDGSSNPGTVAQADILYRYTAYFYDCYARPIQTVTLYPDGIRFLASTKYNYTGLPVRQTARLQVPQGTTAGTDTLNVVLTETFTYDKRGRMLTSNAAMQTFNSFVENGSLAYSDTLSSAASATYSYDELGHLTGKTLGGNLSQTLAYSIQDWMTAMQTKKGTANVFSQTLRYYNPVKPSTTALYSGNISEWETVQGTSTASTYGFTYDTQGRLTNSNRYDGTSTTVSQLYTERDISYDRNGNILALKRISNSIPSPLHNFTYSYDGDKLTALSGSRSGTSFTSAYLYDGNGNMTLDGNQAVRLSYDINNLVHRAKKTAAGQNPSPAQDELTATYSYFADGTKYSIKDTEGNSRIYIGPLTLVRKDYPSSNSGNTAAQHITLLESADVLGSDARFAFTATPQTVSSGDTTYTIAYETLYLLKDHLGSVRTITDSQGNALERNDYYPYGLQTNLGRSYAAIGDKYRVRMPAAFTSGNPSVSNLSVTSPSIEMTPYRMLYNGKELQMVAQTRFVDYGARQYDPTIARWNGMDPMAEKYLSMTSYSYCAGNPIRNTDIEGLLIDDYYDYLTGRYLGTDGASTNNMRIIREDVFRNIVEKNGGQSASKEATLELQDSENSKIITVDYEKINKDILAIADNSFETKIENALYLVLDRKNAVLTSELSSNKGNTNNSSHINGDWAESTKILRRGNDIIVIAQIHGHPKSTSKLITNSGVSDLDVSGAQKNLIPVYAVDAMRKRKGKQVPIHRANPDGTKDNNIGYTCGEGKFKEFDIARDAMNRR
jgi:RHS repeat-associated protein